MDIVDWLSIGDGAVGDHVAGGEGVAGVEHDGNHDDGNTEEVLRVNRSDLHDNSFARVERLVMVVH